MCKQLKYLRNEEGHFICPSCPYTARIQSTMHYHLKKHNGDLPFACSNCDMKFAQKSMLDLHVASKHKEKTEKEVFKCPCKSCDYTDIRKGNRLIHFIRVHLKDLAEKLKTACYTEGCQVSCSACQKDFKSMTQFYYHSSSCISITETHPLWKSWVEVK